MAGLSEHEAYIVLNLVSGVGPSRLENLLQRFGSAAGILEQSERTLTQVPTVGASLAAKIAGWEKGCDLSGECQLAERSGVQIVTRADAGYPESLRNIPNGPLLLYVRGQLPEDIGMRSLAVVGTRRMTRYGRDMTKHLTEAAVMAGWVIVSGLAVGVDAVAHESTLVLGGITVGVIGCGLGRIYPQEHVSLARQAVESGGAIVSEFPMMMPPNARTFPMRNRIVAGMVRGVLVIEAGLGSGALITANMGVEYGKSIFAVPGAVDNPLSRGCHALIKQGAMLVESFDDIAAEFSFLPGFEPPKNSRICEACDSFPLEEGAGDPMAAAEMQILTVLRKGEQSLEQLSLLTGLPTGILMGLVMQMELKRRIRATPKGQYGIIL